MFKVFYHGLKRNPTRIVSDGEKSVVDAGAFSSIYPTGIALLAIGAEPVGTGEETSENVPANAAPRERPSRFVKLVVTAADAEIRGVAAPSNTTPPPTLVSTLN